jgi:hypothetical protein
VIVLNPEDRLAFFREQAAEANARADAATPLSQGHGNLMNIAASWQRLAAIEEALRRVHHTTTAHR